MDSPDSLSSGQDELLGIFSLFARTISFFDICCEGGSHPKAELFTVAIKGIGGVCR